MIQADITGVQALIGTLTELSRPMDDIARRIRAVLTNQHTRRVAVEKTDPDNGAWAPLAPSTLARKRGSMLVETGRLLGSFVSEVSGLTVTLDNQADPYAVFHQTGTEFMPARPFMGMGEDDIDEIMDACLAMIERRLR